MRVVWLATVLGLAAVACDRGHPREQPSKPAPGAAPLAPMAAPAAADPGAAAGPCTLAALPLRRPMPRRLIAIGDLHGDLAAARSALRAAGAIDDRDRWIGGDLVVVQTGDVLDRGDDEQAILDLVAKLEREAQAAGGALIMLIGNHELMNAAGDFRYVTPGALNDFDDAATGADRAKYAEAPEAVRGRLAALGPGGTYAKRIAEHAVIAIVGDIVFSHAGVLGDWVTQVEEVNRSARCWLDGQAGGIEAVPLVMTSQTSPVWTRAVGFDTDCEQAKAALGALGVKRMVVGHTVQQEINAACDGTVWRIDVGLGKLYGGPIQVLELVPGVPPKVIAGTR